MMLKERIKSAFDFLMTNRGEDWFMILEEVKEKGKEEEANFVQFTYDEGYGIQLDIPVVSLEEDALKKTEKLMAEYDIKQEEIQFHDDCCCGEDHDHDDDCDCGCHDEDEEPFFSFNKKMDSVDQAKEIAYRMLTEVFGLTSTSEINVVVSR